MLDELQRKLLGKFRFNPEVAEVLLDTIFQSFRIVRPAPLSSRASRDPDDDMVLATAKAGACDVIITGDKDLLDLGTYDGIRIVSPGAFWAIEHPHG